MSALRIFKNSRLNTGRFGLRGNQITCLLLCGFFLIGIQLTSATTLALPQQFDFLYFDYHGPYIDELVFSVYHGAESQLAALTDELIDVGNSPVSPEDQSDIQYDAWEVNAFWGLACSTHDDPFFIGEPVEGPPGLTGFPLNYLALRRAIAMAIDKYELAEVCFGSDGVALDNVVPEYLQEWYEPDLPIDYRASDIDGAIALLEEAGFTDFNSDGIRDAPGEEEVSIRLYYTPLNAKKIIITNIGTNTTILAEMIGDALGQLGFEYNLYPVSETTLWYYTHWGSRSYNLALLPFNILDRSLSYLTDLFYSWSIPTTNIMNFHNETVDTLLETLNTTTDYDTFKSIASDIQVAIAQNQPLIPLCTKYQYTAHRTDQYENWVNAPGFGAPNTWSLLQARLKSNQPNRNQVSGVGGTLEFGLNNPPDNLNPLLATYDDSWLVLNSIYSRLIDWNPFTGEAVPNLAKSWFVEPEGDGLKITFNLLNNVTWHDEAPFSAYDVNFTFYYINSAPEFYPISSIEFSSIEILNNVTIVVHTPLNGYMALFEIGNQIILPKHIWEGIVRPGDFSNPRPVGTGPFRFVKQPEAGLIYLEYYPLYHYGIPGSRELPVFIDIDFFVWLSGGLFVVVITVIGAIWLLRRTPHGLVPD
ncbi:MAG: ABC transporter substrate-binding protein [Promethearchaeota archaeon]